jgi:hypothetical protein
METTMKPLGMKYYRRVNASGHVETLHFSRHSLKEIGLSENLGWMPVVEGLMLINKWNQEANGNYTYLVK